MGALDRGSRLGWCLLTGQMLINTESVIKDCVTACEYHIRLTKSPHSLVLHAHASVSEQYLGPENG